ncbi:MAG: hypothetical protein ACI9JN_002431 [Bacteroidia bacterium]|jgi:hypothetical protein
MALPIICQAQNSEFLSKTKSYGMGFQVKSNGFGFAYQQQNFSYKHFDRYYYVDFGSFKHTNESKIVNHKVENKMPYVYGKLFHTAVLRAASGVSLTLVKPNLQNDIAIDIQGALGLSIGLQRPVYLRIETLENDQKTVKTIKYSRGDVPTSEDIIGYSKNGEGWGALEYRPGVVGHFNVAFSWDEFAQVSKRVNVGGSLDYFPQGLPIMAFDQNPKLNATFYIGFMWVINQG